MATFAVIVERLAIEPHPNADRLEIARVGDYQSIVAKGSYRTGDLAAYIPEGAVVPERVLEELGLVGRLAGPEANRVKAVRLRGVLSQGICYSAREGWRQGQDVTEALGVTKYEPPVPTSMDGEVWSAGHERCVRYDIENIKRYPRVLQPGEEVVVCEKIHGTWCQIGVMPEAMADEAYGRLVVSSKGLAGRGLAFMPEAEANRGNLYLRVARQLELERRLGDEARDEPVFVLGEVFGQGVQDLGYGASTARDDTLGFRVFDVYLGCPGQGRYLGDEELEQFCRRHELERVPVLWRGPFDRGQLEALTTGAESVSGQQAHLREGVVVRPVVERRDDELGRVQLKSVSDAYLLRKGGTEYN